MNLCRGSVIAFLDIAGAFGSCNRNRIFVDLATKIPGDNSFYKHKHLSNNLKMHFDHEFIDKTNIEVEYLTGNPEDSVSIDMIWACLMVTIVT